MLMWRPLHVELLSEAPKVALVYNFLTRSEARTLRVLATPYLYRAQVFGDDRRQIPASTRISKVAWLRDDPSSFVARLSTAVSAATGLRIESAELMQVVNYGVGRPLHSARRLHAAARTFQRHGDDPGSARGHLAHVPVQRYRRRRHHLPQSRN
ncbi:hypothetical protein HPB51_009424 [Rhipicephalus microplus]|uniref:Uncharacterized protein n=1 Tax=Rhipicephalus microplus TaxID=6941 RepID=A0A9J6E0I6_RHIMP|nr:hypothetical protein HPB51_009424 [Rhipicephalus microplus]